MLGDICKTSMLNVVMLGDICKTSMLNVVMLESVMLSVEAPNKMVAG